MDDEYPHVTEWQRDIVERHADKLSTAGQDPLEVLNAAQAPTSEPDGPAAPAYDVGSPDRARDAMLRNIGAAVLAQVELLHRMELDAAKSFLGEDTEIIDGTREDIEFHQKTADEHAADLLEEIDAADG